MPVLQCGANKLEYSSKIIQECEKMQCSGLSVSSPWAIILISVRQSKNSEAKVQIPSPCQKPKDFAEQKPYKSAPAFSGVFRCQKRKKRLGAVVLTAPRPCSTHILLIFRYFRPKAGKNPTFIMVDKSGGLLWSEWRDLNSRPLGPEPSTLPTALHPDIGKTELYCLWGEMSSIFRKVFFLFL